MIPQEMIHGEIYYFESPSPWICKFAYIHEGGKLHVYGCTHPDKDYWGDTTFMNSKTIYLIDIKEGIGSYIKNLRLANESERAHYDKLAKKHGEAIPNEYDIERIVKYIGSGLQLPIFN